MMIFRCEDSTDAIFTAIYDAWDSGLGHNNIKIEVILRNETYHELELFAEYTTVISDSDKAEKVARSIKQKISEDAYQMVVHAAISYFPQKGDDIYRFLILGFRMGSEVIHHLADPTVCKLFEMNRYVGNEVHFFKGFLRFEEVEQNILFAKYEPKSNITEALMPHFADRFKEENLVILDISRKIAAFHQKGIDWFITDVSEGVIQALTAVSSQEKEYQFLWKTFFESIAIDARKNKKLQRNMLRLHYRKYMTEFL